MVYGIAIPTLVDLAGKPEKHTLWRGVEQSVGTRSATFFVCFRLESEWPSTLWQFNVAIDNGHL